MRKVSMAEAGQHLDEYVRSAEGSRERTIIMKKGRPVAVIMSVNELESIEETNAILSDPELMREIREAEAELARGEGFSLEQVRSEFEQRRRQQ